MVLVFALGITFAGAGSADLIDFSTVNSMLSCGGASNCTDGGGNVATFGLSSGGSAQLQVTYSANIENDLDVSPVATTNFGQLFLLCVNCAGQTGNFNLNGATLALNVDQGPDPFTGSGTFGVGQLSGTLSLNAGNFGGLGQVSWLSPAMFVVSDGAQSTFYTLQQPSPPTPPAYFLSINAATTLQGFVDSEGNGLPGPVTIPEPSTHLLFGIGLLALGLLRRRGVV
jgi:hypothetical protein